PNCPASMAVRMVCSNPSKCAVGSRLVVDDAASYATKTMRGGSVPDIIVPAIPGNSLAMIFARWISDTGFSVEPDAESFKRTSREIPKELILTENENMATLILSYAKDFMCSPWCKEPEICPVTGEKILKPVHSIMTGIGFFTCNEVFRSKLIGKGIGAVDGRQVYNELIKLPHDKEFYTVCVGAACQCHGIFTFLRCLKK
ncbi:MAG: hypothetical protein ACP5KV_04970, partial [Candidatus Methanomethylicaceae archaeon]